MIEDVNLSFLVTAVQLFPSHHRIRKLERSVLNALGIQTTISAEVYVLKEQPKQRPRDRSARLIDLHGDVLRLNNRNQEQGR